MDHLSDAEFNRTDVAQERRQKIGAFITDELHISHQVLQEHVMQAEEFREFEARPYQQDAWVAIWQAREAGETRGLIHLATGLGKTSIAVVDFAKFANEQEANGGRKPRALFVVHQDTILEQADERFRQMIPGINTQFFTTQQADLPDTDVLFATFQSLSREIHRFSPDYFDYIIYDEAHHTKAKTYERVVEHFDPKFELAMTATPDRMDGRDITDYFGEPLYSKTLAEAMTEGYLADVEYMIVGDDAVKEVIANGFEAKSIRDLQRLLELDMRNEEIIARIEEKKVEIRQREGIDVVKTAIYTDSVEYANYIANLLNTDAYHSKMSKMRQKEVLLRFRNDESEDIVVKDMINEGVDIPNIRLIVFLRSTQSKNIFEQQLGRGLRRSPGKDRTYVMDFVANIERIEFIQDIAEQYNFYAFGTGGSVRRGDHRSRDTRGRPLGFEEDQVPHASFEFGEEIIDILGKYKTLLEKNSRRERWIEWTDESIAELARTISPDAPLSAVQMAELSKEGTFPNHKTIAERFGSISNFQRFCGFEVLNWAGYTRSEIIELAKELSPDKYMIVDDINAYSKKRLFPSSIFVSEMFGGLRQFQKEVWGREWTDWKQYSSEELISLALDLSPDKPLTTKKIDELSKNKQFPYQSVIAEMFGSLREFQVQCGFDPRDDWTQYSVEELALKLKALSPDVPLTNPMINRLSKQGLSPAASTIVSIFGSFANMQRACGFEVFERIKWSTVSDDELVSLALRISPDKNLTSVQVIELSKEGKFISNSMLFTRFGSIRAFHELCERKRLYG